MSMAKCPKCGAEIDHLDYYEVSEVLYEAEYYGDVNYADLREAEVIFVKEQYYRCPKCGETVAEDENEANEIIKGVSE
jgi:ssDNA-binding Zn-finger/Zn-ribbon topoisomerase 1